MNDTYIQYNILNYRFKLPGHYSFNLHHLMCGRHVLKGAITDLDNQVDRESC